VNRSCIGRAGCCSSTVKCQQRAFPVNLTPADQRSRQAKLPRKPFGAHEIVFLARWAVVTRNPGRRQTARVRYGDITGVISDNAVSREWLNAYECGLGEQSSLQASDPQMGWDESGTKALVDSQFVLARDVQFSCAVFVCRLVNLLKLEWVGEKVTLTRTRIQAAHGTVPLKCAGNTRPARPGILYRPAPGVQRCRLLPTSATRAPEATPN